MMTIFIMTMIIQVLKKIIRIYDNNIYSDKDDNDDDDVD